MVSFLFEAFFLFFGFEHNLVEFAFLERQVGFALFEDGLIVLEVVLALVDADESLFDFFVAKLDFEALEFNFLAQCVVLAIVLHLVELLVVAFNAGLCLGYFGFFLRHGSGEVVHLVTNFLNAEAKAFNLVFQVLYFQRQFASQGTLLIDGRECCLQLIKSLQFLFNREFGGFFFCHNYK